jgi:opacity protein-like surface antigen
MPAGWYADVAYDLDEMVSFVGDVSGAYKSTDFEETVLNVTVSQETNIRIHTFMGGVRFTARQSALRPFAQVLFGAAHASADADSTISGPGVPPRTSQSSTSSTELAFDLGGGFSFPATENLDMRVGASYLRIGGDGGGNGFRLSFGAIFPF